MNKNISLLIISLAVVGISCKKDFLEVIDKTKLLRQGYVVDLETTGHYMNGIYVQLAIGCADGSKLIYPEYLADNMKFRFGTNDVYYWNQTVANPTGTNGAGQWNTYYQIIRACNFVIEKANEYKAENEIKANSLKGQALTIRAWMHFLLVNMFAQSYNFTANASHLGVPYVVTSNIEEKISRQTVAEVYDNMINDVNEALQLLPTSIANKTYINYGAAKALLARVYLFREDFAKAKNLSLDVLNQAPLMIANYPADLYTPQETEALFQVAPANSATDNYGSFFLGYFTTALRTRLPTNDIIQLYRQYPTDKRNAWVRDTVIGSTSFKLITKFPIGVTGTNSIPESDYYQTFFRSSEMALTAAESYAKLNMEDSARYFINQIRSRTNIPVITSAITGSALMDSIRTERRKEMAFDGIRMYDLMRWKQGVNRVDASAGAPKILPYPSDKAIAPIPLADVQLSELQQNPSY